MSPRDFRLDFWLALACICLDTYCNKCSEFICSDVLIYLEYIFFFSHSLSAPHALFSFHYFWDTFLYEYYICIKFNLSICTV